MPLAPVHFRIFSSMYASARVLSALGVLSVMVLLAGCSSPKAAGPAGPPGSARVEALEAPNADNSAAAGQADPFIATVRTGTMSGYPQATIGHAFEAAFKDAHWSSRQSEQGVHVVTFTGFLPANMRPDCGPAKAGAIASPCASAGKVIFEWTFGSDGGRFHLSHIDPEPWPESRRTTRDMLLFIYG